MFKKGYTLSEVLVAMMIISVLIVMVARALHPKIYEQKTNLLSARKTIQTFDSSIFQMLEEEKIQCPTSSFMTIPAGMSDYVFTVVDEENEEADAAAIVAIFGRYLKHEKEGIKFCDFTSFCSNEEIIGAKLAGGVYYGVEKFEQIGDCPDYIIPGETENAPTPQGKCWGKLYIDVRPENKGKEELGDDIFVFGLGEHGIAR